MSSLIGLEVDPLLGVDAAEVVIAAGIGIEFDGVIRVTTGQPIVVQGKVTGSIHSNGAVVVGAHGAVHGSVTASALQLIGSIERVKADDFVDISGPLILGASAVLKCDAESRGLQMTYGAIIHGSLRPKDAVASKSPKPMPTPMPTAPTPAPILQD